MKQVTPFLWFRKDAEKAARLYVSLFRNSKILAIARNTTGITGKPGRVMTVRFRLNGQEYLAFNGGPDLKLTTAYSMFVTCKDQQEVDRLWNKLVKGGRPIQCGWLEDRYGLAWQIIPNGMLELIGHKDRTKAGRAARAMLKMVKIDFARIKSAFRGPA